MQEKEYYTLNEVATMIGKNRATIYNRMKIIKMKGHKFKGDSKTYLSAEEVEQIKTVFEKPWTAPEKDDTKEVA